MTFSDPEVAAYVNENFVSAWHNRGPGFSNHEFTTEKSIFTHSMEAFPTKNICTFFLTPEGKVFFYVSGYYSPDLFLRVLQTVMTLRASLFDEGLRLRAEGLADARKAHARAAKFIQASIAGARLWEAGRWREFMAGYREFTYRGSPHRHSSSCAGVLTAALQYVSELHVRWSKTDSLPDLDAVRYAYLSGNPFTEEAADSKTVEDPPPLAANEQAPPPAPPAPQPKEKKKSETAQAKAVSVKFPAGRSFAGVVLRQ